MTGVPRTERELLAELATLASLTLAAGPARTSREVATAALEILKRSTGADTGVVIFDDGEGIDVEAEYGFADGAIDRALSGRSISPELGAALERASGPIHVPLARAPIHVDVADALRNAGVRQLSIAPLKASGKLVGLIGLGWRVGPDNPPPDAAILHASVIVGPTLENARLVERLQRTLDAERRLADEEAALQSLTLIADTAGAFDELAATTIRQIVDLLDADAGSYALIENDDLHHAAWVGVADAFIDLLRGVPAGMWTPVQRLDAGGAAYVQAGFLESANPRKALSIAARELGFTAYAAIPVRVGERLEAVVILWFRRPVDVTAMERALDGVGRIASISLANFRLRERLQASEARYRVLFESSPDAIVLLSTAPELIDANPAAVRLYRTDLAGLREFMASGVAAVGPDERKRRLDVVRREGRGVFRETGIRPDGTTFPAELGIVPVEIRAETRYLLIIRDLTEQERLQQELLQAQKMEAIGQLVSGVAHELNNPLAAIVAFSQLIRRDARLPHDLHRDAELLVQEADRTRRIVQNLLDFARQRPPERHPTSIGTLFESVLALQSYTLSSGHIELSQDVPADLPLIDVDRSQLQQVMLNLTLNAIQSIRAQRNAGHIWITARPVGSRGGARLRIEVSDDGPGIEEADHSRLFLPFYTTKDPGEGTGLGLSVSFGIVAAHGGSLQFEPRPGGGATFIVELPVSGRQPSDRRRGVGVGGAREAASPSDTAAGGPTDATTSTIVDASVTPSDGPAARVLVLDDEPAIRAFLTKSLRLAGLDPVVVASGEEAIARCRDRGFAAVLVDHRMPGMSGTEVYEAVVAIRPGLASQFIFMSGDVLNPDLRDFASTHDVALLAKPFDVDTVNRLVTEVVDRADQRG